MNPRYSKPASCAGCALESSGWGFVPPFGSLGARLQFVGEAAGGEEVVRGEPFVGAAGGVLTRVLHRAGIERGHVRILNCVSCHPPNDYLVDAPWEHAALGQCWATQLQPALTMLPNDGVAVALGATPLKQLLGLHGVPGVAIKDFHGTVNRDPSNRFWIVPTFHPSHLQRGAMNLLEVVTQDLLLAAKIASQGFKRSPATLVVDPEFPWLQNWVSDHLRRLDVEPDFPLALDTEFPEKIGGQDESEVTAWNAVSPILRVNGGNDPTLGWTVPYRQPFIGEIERLLAGIAARRGIVWLWNKYADWEHLRQAGHTLAEIMAIDLMWLWHYLQSDLPRGLGFVAPMASDFGPWKHWAKQKEKEGPYAAADGLQTKRVGNWLVASAVKHRVWEIFLNDWHYRDQYVLRPAHEMGTPIDRVELVAFHADLQQKQQRILARLKQTAAAGTLKPKAGYRKRPSLGICGHCDGTGVPIEFCPRCGCARPFNSLCQNYGCEGTTPPAPNLPRCEPCGGTGVFTPTPPASILGKPKKGGGEAKSAYMLEGVTLVERTVEVDTRCCESCGAVSVGAKHRCRDRALAANVVVRRVAATRWFWQLPFNPDAPAQVLAYIAAQGEQAPEHKKTRKPTTAKDGLKALAKKTEDPFYQLQLDWKAVTKVDATYAVGTLNRLDHDDRVHPEFLPKPSTLRDSAIDPNLQNVVADKAGPDGLASGFRRCIVARDGVPPGVTEDELSQWRQRWSVQ